MFTGIIKEIGKVINIDSAAQSKKIEISCLKILKDLKTGDSVSVNGCCLTAAEVLGNSFVCDISYSTIKSTTFSSVKTGDYVNLEDSLRFSDKLGGHFVAGHVDTTVKMLNTENIGSSYRFSFELPQDFKAYIVPKGSVTVDGISLTVEQAGKNFFSVAIIAHTYKNTVLKMKKPGDIFNLEIDLLARYIENIINLNLLKKEQESIFEKDRKLKEKLIEYGF